LVSVIILSTVIAAAYHPDVKESVVSPPNSPSVNIPIEVSGEAAAVLAKLDVKGKAAKTGYARSQFGDGWGMDRGCDTRNVILRRDLIKIAVDEQCHVTSGILNDPYTGMTVNFTRGEVSSQEVQIDHVVALSNAWQTGAQQLTLEQRVVFANDPLELLAVDGTTNQQKSDSDAASWLPPNKSYRCAYVARQIAVKGKYRLWVTAAERDAMLRVLAICPGQTVPTS
jgi:hypothetical protein